MKTKLIATALFAATAGTIAFLPLHQSIGATPPAHIQTKPIEAIDPIGNLLVDQRPKIEVVFVLDTTGSMSGLIQAAKEKIWSIASTMASANGAPEIKMGLVAYRDRGDAYVTRVTDLSGDLDSVYATLMDFQAKGGGDDPESVNQALYDAVHGISWSQDPNTYKVVFLVGDAPPHMDYQGEVEYPETLAAASTMGIAVNAIQCGNHTMTTRPWQHIASLGEGSYFRVEQAGSAVAITTPFDSDLAELSARLDDTRLYYGDEAKKREKHRKVEATDKLHAESSLASRARRAVFNTSDSGETNLFGDAELVEDVASGRVELSAIAPEELPAPMQAMAPEEQEALIKETSERRSQLKQQIRQLADQRAAYLEKSVDEAGGAADSLDDNIYRAVREQAARKGLSYESDAPLY